MSVKTYSCVPHTSHPDALPFVLFVFFGATTKLILDPLTNVQQALGRGNDVERCGYCTAHLEISQDTDKHGDRFTIALMTGTNFKVRNPQRASSKLPFHVLRFLEHKR